MDNITLLHQLLAQGKIACQASPLFEQEPTPLPADWDFSRVEAMRLGLAIGDALGNTSESMLPSMRRQAYGEIRDYLPNPHAGGRPLGLPSDDTQLAFWTLEQLLEDKMLLPENLARKFTQGQIYGIGSTMRGFLRSYKDHARSWQQSGQPSAGNGALMRIAPLLIPHLRRPSPALWADAAIAGMITHNDPASIACCVAFIHLLWECLHLEHAPASQWWLDTFVAQARLLEGDSSYTSRNAAQPYQGPVWQFVEREVGRALQENLSVLEACQRWHSGAYLLETLPCVLYILARHGNDPEEALLRAVNDTWDNDTIAAIVGAAVGALHGRSGLPPRWISGLLGRTSADDDWHIFELIEAVKQSFWHAHPALTEENILAVLNYLPAFEQPSFSPGEWVTLQGSLPYFDYSAEVIAFKKTLYANDYIQPFNWSKWYEGLLLMDHPELLQKASLQTLRKLLTAHVRADRFNEGHLADIFESGHMLMILRRLTEIQQTGT